MTRPKYRELRRSYGFDEVALVPGDITINPDQTNIELKIEDFTLAIPVLIIYMVLNNRVDSMTEDMDQQAETFLELALNPAEK